ncbi:hypothetical protein V8J82_12975 [Gymnodinialimonas sp. 2305UL16-5]|uniref:hypothetical protein n=1 Tax=Gymnodinialimonas mytili TaxID=3126503 RepID=UPI0030AD0DAA
MHTLRQSFVFGGLGLSGLAVIFAINSSATAEVLPLDTTSLNLTSVTNLCVIFVLLSLMIERACTVAMGALTALGVLPVKAQNKMRQPRRNLTAFLICLTFASLIAANGLFLSELVLTSVIPDGADARFSSGFRYIDTALTALVLAGGSEGIHKMIKRFCPAHPLPDSQ